MLQTVVVAALLLAGGIIARANLPILHSQVPLAIPGTVGIPVTYFWIFTAMGGALVLVWLGGQMDAQILRAQLRRRDGLLRAAEQELMRMKSIAYDQQQPALADIRGRLEEVRQVLARIETVAARPEHPVRTQVGATSLP